MANIKQLKEMMKEPSSKEWFKKHGLPGKKKEVAKKMDHGFKFPKWEKQREHLKKSGASEKNLSREDKIRAMQKKGNSFPTIGDMLKNK